MRSVGLEPTPSFEDQHLKLARIPFRHDRIQKRLDTRTRTWSVLSATH